jgi:hypothetical protein
MSGLVGNAPACYGRPLGSNPDISQKYKLDDMSKGVANTLFKNIRKKKKLYALIKYKRHIFLTANFEKYFS